jgi:ABC-type phosphate transport system substrate-binding protein
MKLPGSRVRSLWIAFILGLSAMPAKAQADIYIIVNSSLTLTVEDLKSIYTGDKELIGSVKVKPSDNRAGQSEFLSKVLGLNQNRYDSLWTMKSFRDGLTTPSTKSSDSEVIAYVQSVPGAIGYVTSPPPAGVVVLKKY